jgi:regulatory protein
MKNDNYINALKKASELCGKREKCSSEVVAKLESWGSTSDNDNRKIINWLKENGFIDESRYSGKFARDKFRFNKWGAIKIRTALRSKGISENDIESALASIDEDDYYNTLKELLASKKKGIKASNLFDLKGKLYRFGSSHGFESDLVYKVINDLVSG